MQLEKISKIKPNESNPRFIKDEKFSKLVKSLKDFPEMANARPIIVNTDMVVLGGNMRLKAMKEAGWKEAPILIVDWPEDKQKEFIIKDNVGFGDWDYDALANGWDENNLQEWGLDLPGFDTTDYSDKNKEIDVDGMEDKMLIKLKFTEDDYNIVKGQLLRIAATPEQAVWKLLGNE